MFIRDRFPCLYHYCPQSFQSYSIFSMLDKMNYCLLL